MVMPSARQTQIFFSWTSEHPWLRGIQAKEAPSPPNLILIESRFCAHLAYGAHAQLYHTVSPQQESTWCALFQL